MLLLLLSSLNAQAQVPVSSPPVGAALSAEHSGGSLGLGIGIGSLTGLAGKMWIGDWSGLHFAVGGDSGEVGDLGVTVDYVIHLRPFQAPTNEISVPLHLGAGFNLSTNVSGAGLVTTGPRLVFGASVMVRDMPIDIFMEAAPTFFFYEYPTWAFDGQTGVRYYF